MRKELTDITLLLDRSGSMNSVASDAIGGVNAFVETQRKGPGEALMTLVQFDDQYEVVYSGVALPSVVPLNDKTYQPRGCTALYDAICRAMDETGARLEKIPEAQRPGLVVFAILTDGLENASQKHTMKDVSERITRQRNDYNWQVLFLAANQDACATGERLAIPAAAAMTYDPTANGVQAAFAATGANLCSARAAFASGGSVTAVRSSLHYNDAQRAKATSGK